MGIISPAKRNAVFKGLLVFLVLILSPILLAAVLCYATWGAILYMAIWLTSKKQFVVFVYSDSPTWKDYMEGEILPYLQDQAVILNWSKRRSWKNSMAVLAFRYFGGHRNFNPIGIVFRPFRLAKTYRFFEAFKQGNLKRVEKIRRELIQDLGV
jgi:hypothetical protein